MQVKISDLSGITLSWVCYEVYYADLIKKGSHVKQWALDNHKSGEVESDVSDCSITFSGLIIQEKIALKPVEGSSLDTWEATKGNISITGIGPIEAVLRCYIMNHYQLTSSDQTVFVHDAVK